MTVAPLIAKEGAGETVPVNVDESYDTSVALFANPVPIRTIPAVIVPVIEPAARSPDVLTDTLFNTP